MGAEVIIPLLLTAASSGLQYQNTKQTAKREDRALAESIRNQSGKQKQADARTNEEISKLQGSSSADEEAQRTDNYIQQLRRNRAGMQGNLTPGVGGETFSADMATAGQGVDQMAGETAGLMAQVDAPGMQRTNEGAGFGKLATDISLLQRESRGQAYIDELRRRTIKRNPWMDMAAGFAGTAAGAMGGGGMFGGAGAGATPGGNPSQYGWIGKGY